MTIEIKPETYYIGMWFCRLPNNGGDYMCCIYREPDQPWTMKFRFRYYKDGKAHDSKDEKRWYQAVIGAEHNQDPHVIEREHDTVCRMGHAKGMLESVTFVRCQGMGDKMAEIMKSSEAPWLHKKVMSQKEYEEYEKADADREG